MSRLEEVLQCLLDEASVSAGPPDEDYTDQSDSDDGHAHPYAAYKAHLPFLDKSSKLQLLHQLLCIRPPSPTLPETTLDQLDDILHHQRSRRILTVASSLPEARTVNHASGMSTRLVLWRGDITTLARVTAITNAANGQMLGCFQPSHRCIDNIIHSFAGPRLRHECYRLMKARGDVPLQPGESLVTNGYALPSPFVIHTVGPQLRRGAKPTTVQQQQLGACYHRVLEDAERLPAGEDGRKAVALCCISTGLFGFPTALAASIAVATVTSWLNENPSTTITDVIFNVFTESDHELYSKLLCETSVGSSRSPIQVEAESLDVARKWLENADCVLLSAGAGLSASDGLDYTSVPLFTKHFPGFMKYGLRRLYDVFGFDAWPGEQDRWGYYFTHLSMVQQWPKSPIYKTLISWLAKFGDNAHVRTSNADGLFLANGLPENRLSTPQGSYSVLQCLSNCRPEAVVSSAELVDEALAFLDPMTQRLTDPKKVPRCAFCGGRMNICVRAGPWFNQNPFSEGERRYNDFRKKVLNEQCDRKLVILELGAGMNTPGVLRWPNEALALEPSGNIRLIRIGMGVDSVVPDDLENEGSAVNIDGDIGLAINNLLK